MAIHHVADKDILCKMVEGDDCWLLPEPSKALLIPDEKGMLPIHHAVRDNRQAVVRQMLEIDRSLREEGQALGLLEKTDNSRMTPFHHACWSGWQDMASLLKEEMKANDKAKDENGKVNRDDAPNRTAAPCPQLSAHGSLLPSTVLICARAHGRLPRIWSRSAWNKSPRCRKIVN
eukprot:6525854-Prymnesium_polylepis.1